MTLADVPQMCHSLTSRAGAGNTALGSNHKRIRGAMMAEKPLCSIPDCGKVAAAGRKGFCGSHYKRQIRYGDPLAGGRMRPEKGEPLAWLKRHVIYDGDECLTWPFGQKGWGYGAVVGEGGKLTGAHIEMCRLAHGEKPSPDHLVRHSCGNGHLACVNPRHLAWGTHLQNMRDKYRDGTMPMGMNSGASRLSDSAVIFIRANQGKLTQAQLGNMFGIHQATVSSIQLRKTWRHIP